METLTFDVSTHERAHQCVTLLRSEGLTVRVVALLPEAHPGVEVDVDTGGAKWATALVRAVDPGARLRP